MNMRNTTLVPLLAFCAFVAGSAARDAYAQSFQFPSYDVDILECGNPDLIQARLVVDILAPQLLDAQLQLAMHAANRAEALRRPNPDADYAEGLLAAIADDRARIAMLEERLACWRRRYDDIVAGRPLSDPNQAADSVVLPPAPEPADQVPQLDPDVLASLDVSLDAMLAAAADYQAIASSLDAAMRALADVAVEDDGRAPAIGPTGGVIIEPDPSAAAEARNAAAGRLDGMSEELAGPLYGALIDSQGNSIPVPVGPGSD